MIVNEEHAEPKPFIVSLAEVRRCVAEYHSIPRYAEHSRLYREMLEKESSGAGPATVKKGGDS